jgi:hypothetical protein
MSAVTFSMEFVTLAHSAPDSKIACWFNDHTISSEPCQACPRPALTVNFEIMQVESVQFFWGPEKMLFLQGRVLS